MATLVYKQPLQRWYHRGGSKVRAANFLRALRELLAVRRAAPHWFRPLRAANAVTAEVTASV